MMLLVVFANDVVVIQSDAAADPADISDVLKLECPFFRSLDALDSVVASTSRRQHDRMADGIDAQHRRGTHPTNRSNRRRRRHGESV